MNRLIFTLLILLPILSTTGCHKSQEEVVVYTSVDRIYADPIFHDFELATGIKVLAVYDVEANKTTGLATRLLLEKDYPSADVFWNSEIMYTLQLKEAGVLEPFSATPTYLPKNFIDPDHQWIAFGGRSKVWIIHKNVLPISSYPQHLSDSYTMANSYKTSIANPVFGTTATYAANIYALLGPEEGYALFQHIKEQAFIANGNGAVRDLVASGQIDFGLTDTDDALAAIKKNAPVDIRFLTTSSDKLFIIPNTVARIKSGPNKQNASLFIQYLLKESTVKKMLSLGSIQFHVTNVVTPAIDLIPFLPQDTVTIQETDYPRLYQLLTRSSSDMKELFLE